jgi:beta-1,4-mannosyltransferase
MRAYFEPKSHANKFISINLNALKKMGCEIFKLNAMLSVKTEWKNRNKALVVMNWVEDQMYRKDATMLSTMRSFICYQFFLFLSLIFCKNKIWIRHNFVPHNANGNLVYF